MRVRTGPIAMALPGWSLKNDAITSVVDNDAGGRADVLVAQMLCGAAVSGVKVLVLLPGLRGDDPAWRVVGDLLGGGDTKKSAQAMKQMKLLMYTSGLGREHVGKAELVYAPGLSRAEIGRVTDNTSAPVLTLTDLEGETAKRLSSEVIRVGGDMIALDAEGIEIPVVFDPSGPVYRPA